MNNIKVTILGSGTSIGVPQMGCTCPTCMSTDKRDKRLRCSSILEINDPHSPDGITRILFDCGPDFRQQILQYGFKRIDAIFITHEHSDHVGGLDDLRPFSVFGDMKVYADAYSAKHLKERLPYCFTPKEVRYPGVPQIDLEVVRPGEPVMVNGVKVMPLEVMHGRLPILAYRIGEFAYITDMKSIDESQKRMLVGVKHMVVNALRHEVHPTHQTIEEAIRFVDSLNVETAYFVHMSHHIRPHAQEIIDLPPNRFLAYDGLTFCI